MERTERKQEADSINQFTSVVDRGVNLFLEDKKSNLVIRKYCLLYFILSLVYEIGILRIESNITRLHP